MLIFFIIVGCKKNSTDNTIEFHPLSYLPVYPGSYWEYKTGNDTITSKTSDSLILFDGKYLTTLDYNKIWGYEKYYDNGPVGGRGWVAILSETVNDKMIFLAGDPRYNPIRYETTVLNKTKDNYGDSIIIQKTISFSGPYPNLMPSKIWVYEIYKKEIGLFFKCGIDSLTKDTTFKVTLIKSFINRSWKR